MVLRRTVGSIHPKKLEFWKMESDIQKVNGAYWQRRQELLEQSPQEAYWQYVARCKPALWTQKEIKDSTNDLIIWSRRSGW